MQGWGDKRVPRRCAPRNDNAWVLARRTAEGGCPHINPKVKVPTLVAKNATRMGHPQSPFSTETIC